MNKGTRWYFIVLILVTIPWVVSSTNTKHRRRRQLLRRNAFYLQQLHNGHYLYPIPVTFPPYFKKRATLIHGYPNGVIETPWIPLPNGMSGEIKKNIYIPPLRPPALIVTRKPIRNTFDIPLTKTIQVSPGKPKVKSTGYIRKNLVKIHATRTTTKSPSVRNLAALAESTVQSLLNFTPAHEDWSPKSFTTSHPPFISNSQFGRDLGPKVDKKVNYTGLRYGKVNTVLESKPQNGAGIKVLKNESNFVMRFTPEDVKFTSVNLNAENLDAPFYTDSGDFKNLKNEFKEHSTYSDDISHAQKKDEELRKEVNIPYQGHKTSIDRPFTINNHAINTDIRDRSKDRKTVFDVFSSVQNSNHDHKLKDIPQFQSQGSFINEPVRAENTNSASRNKDSPNKHDAIFITEPLGSQKITNGGITGKPSDKEFSNQFTRPKNSNKINKDQEIKSISDFINENYSPNTPNTRHVNIVESNSQQQPLPVTPQQTFYFDTGSQKYVTGNQRSKDNQQSVSQVSVINNAVKTNINQHSSANNPSQQPSGNNPHQQFSAHNPYQQSQSNNNHQQSEQNTPHQQQSANNPSQQPSGNNLQQILFYDGVTRKSATVNQNNKDIKQSNANFWGNPTKISPKNISSSNGIPTITGNSKDYAVNSFPSGGTYRYNSLSNLFKNNSTHDQSAIKISEFPLSFGVEYDKNSSRQPNTLDHRDIKNNQDHNTVVKFQDFDSHEHNPNLHTVSVSHEDSSGANGNGGLEYGGIITSKPVFEQENRLKEIELKNPPKYLQFGHEDFVKTVTHSSLETSNDDTKQLSTFHFSARDKSQEVLHKQPTDTSSETKTKLTKLQNSFTTHLPTSKVEYDDDTSQSITNKPSLEEIDDIYFQPVFPGIAQEKSLENPKQKLQNYNSGEAIQQSSGESKEDSSQSTNLSNSPKPNIKLPNLYDKSKDKYRNTVDVNNDVIIITHPSYSPEDNKINVGRTFSVSGGSVNDIPQIITPPPVITVKFDASDADNVLTKKGNLVKRVNRTDNYVIHRKPSLVPERDGKPRKPRITISTGMLAGILIAALVFLGFLTGSMVYAFHQWKFSRARGDRQKKKARNPVFPPEYLDENFAGNTYIHNNIFLPTPQNMDERNPSDPDITSMMGEDAAQDQLQQFRSSSRARRYRFRDPQID